MVRRTLRFLFTLWAMLSLLVCIVAIVFWVRGYFAGDQITHTRHRVSPQPSVVVDGREVKQPDESSEETWAVLSGTGRLAIALTATANLSNGKAEGWSWERVNPGALGPLNPTPLGRLGFKFESAAVPLGGGGAFVFFVGAVAPAWFVVLLTALLPGLWYVLWRRRRRTRLRVMLGQCLRCGYDLRESPDRCPECGTMPAKMVLGTTPTPVPL